MGSSKAVSMYDLVVDNSQEHISAPSGENPAQAQATAQAQAQAPVPAPAPAPAPVLARRPVAPMQRLAYWVQRA